MKKFKIYVQWSEPQASAFEVEAEDEAEACEKLLAEDNGIGEDYQIDKVICLGDVKPEPEPEDPNQMRLFSFDKDELK